MHRVDILSLERSSRGRDREMITPIKYYCEKVLNLNFLSMPVWDFHAMDKYKPKLLLVSNTIGSRVQVEAMRYAHKRMIPVISLLHEGLFIQDIDEIDGQTWGHDENRKKLEHTWMLWSKNSARLCIKQFPELKEKIKVSGAVGFDRYVIYRLMTKEVFLKKYNKPGYKKVVGYAGWEFGMIEKKRVIHWNEKKREFLRKDGERVNAILRSLLENNPDILFVFKIHPMELKPEMSEVVGLASFPNAIIIKNEEAIGDIINVSDIWLAYDSTTALEAWIIDRTKPTIFINPTSENFQRREIYKGTVIVKDYDSLQCLINEYFSAGSVRTFEERLGIRQNIIKLLIEWDDGLNHVRVANYMDDLLKDSTLSKYKPKLDREYFFYTLLHYAIKLLFKFPKLPLFKLPSIKKITIVTDNYNYQELKELENRYYLLLDEFHKNKTTEEKSALYPERV